MGESQKKILRFAALFSCRAQFLSGPISKNVPKHELNGLANEVDNPLKWRERIVKVVGRSASLPPLA
jgi:hypothetical protein